MQVVAALLAGVAAPAEAHLVETGFGAFYDGLAHVALTPSDLLVVVALALLAGQRGAGTARWALLALSLAWMAGGALGAFRPLDTSLPLLTTLTFCTAGALVAFNSKLSAGAVSTLSVIAGLLHGYVTGATMTPGGAGALAVAGSVTAVSCLFAILAAQVTTIGVPWGRIAVRVAGSWVTAAGLLMMGWLARGSI
jgi:hydrogenase/urease accessory protein HupE